MAFVNVDLNDKRRAVQSALKAHWRLFLFQGVGMIILGIVAVCAPVAATLVVDIYIGCLLLVSGVIGLIVMFSAGKVPAFVWGFFTAALSLVVGTALICKPLGGALSLPLVLTAFFIVEGVFQTVTSAAAHRELMPATWGWLLASGIADLALAAIIIAGWPMTPVWALGLLVGINLITSGWAIVMIAMAGREVVRTLNDDFRGVAHR
jgi:uncharacterized membrane protein HdeD (DUF308 family)